MRASDAVMAPLELVSRRIDGAWVDAARTYGGYWHGNRLVPDVPPRAGDIAGWLDRHRKLFAWRGGAYPAVITWYDELDAALPDEVEVERQVALFAPNRDIVPAGDGGAVAFVRLTSDDQWARLLAADEAENPQLGAFVRWRTRSFRALTQCGRGHWYALVNTDGKIVAACGGFSRDGLARFVGNSSVVSANRASG